MATRLSRLHAYPAMVSDELAETLASYLPKTNATVLDPFCGTGRTLVAAAARGARTVGIDVNPLACLITRAKAANVTPNRVGHLGVQAAELRSRVGRVPQLRLHRVGEVTWFSALASRELATIVDWINATRRSSHERLLLAAVLSATARDVSYARTTGWKLHRMSAEARRRHNLSAIASFCKRLEALQHYLDTSDPLAGSVRAYVANATAVSSELARRQVTRSFDAVITSPPYGDSRTTVQYGGISRLCLRAVREVNGLGIPMRTAENIDTVCLGGKTSPHVQRLASDLNLQPWWSGGINNSAIGRVGAFLIECRAAMTGAAQMVVPGGLFICVVGRRLVGGRRLHLDGFIIDLLERQGFGVEDAWRRRIPHKVVPSRVNRFGRDQSGRGAGAIRTMEDEYVLVMRRSSARKGGR